MKYGVVYRITNLETDKCYIGRTKNSLRDRWYAHCHKKSSCSLLRRAINKYGKDSFTIEECASSWDSENLKELEMSLIKQENTLSPNGYNLINNGFGGGEISEETHQKLRVSALGRIHTKETREKLRVAATGRIITEETRQKLRDKIITEETREKHRIAATGRKHTEATRKKLRDREITEETRQNLHYWNEIRRKLGKRNL